MLSTTKHIGINALVDQTLVRGTERTCPLRRDPVAIRTVPQPSRTVICHDHIVAPTIALVAPGSYVRARAGRRLAPCRTLHAPPLEAARVLTGRRACGRPGGGRTPDWCVGSTEWRLLFALVDVFAALCGTRFVVSRCMSGAVTARIAGRNQGARSRSTGSGRWRLSRARGSWRFTRGAVSAHSAAHVC